jgi:predicted HTH transcriptional regulator
VSGDLLEKIRLGEDSFLELKEVRFVGGNVRGPTQSALSDELAAFANSTGGQMLLGVENTRREVVGIPLDRLDDVEQRVLEACEESIKPPLTPIIERLYLPDMNGVDQPVLRIAVTRSLFVHKSAGGYYHRVGSSKREVAPEQLGRLFEQRSQSRLIRFDETPVPTATLADLHEAWWRRFAPAPTLDTPEVLLGKLAMAANAEGVWRPTVAGLLLASERPDRFLPGAFVQAVAYRGTTTVPEAESTYQLDAQDITGPLDQQIGLACAFVRKNMRVAAFKHEGGGREDRPQFSMRAIFEAVTNAVAHRDYSMPGSKVRIRLFQDRLEIFSPGMLPNSMTPESMSLRQSARNEAVTSLLARCPIPESLVEAHRQHIMDKRGEGVPVIMTESSRLSGQVPVYRLIDESELQLTIFAANPESEP